MKCSICGSEWNNANQNTIEIKNCPFCNAPLRPLSANDGSEQSGRFIINNNVLIQYLGGAANAVIPSGVVKIGAGAFHGYNVETVYIPDGVVEIGNNCFNGCEHLKEVRIPDSVLSISDNAFRDTKGVKIVAKKDSYAWKKYANAVELTQVKVEKPIEVNTADLGEKTLEQSKSNDAAIDTISSAQKSTEGRTIGRKKYEWSKLLGCKPGEEPWKNIKGTIFNTQNMKAKRLISAIKPINDQELLWCIATETNRTDVACAAINNITDQKMLAQLSKNNNEAIKLSSVENMKDQSIIEQLALNDTSSTVRLKATERVSDVNVLRKISQHEKNEDVRKAAFFRIATSAEIKNYLLNSNAFSDRDYVKKIKSIQDLIEMALSARCEYIRDEAANLLPTSSPEGNLLKAAASFSTRITLDGVFDYEEAQAICEKSNPDFIRKLAQSHPDPCVRYLARGRKKAEVKGTTFEEQMRSQTRTQREITMEEVSQRCTYLCNCANGIAQNFKKACERQGYKGASLCEYRTRVWIDHRSDKRSSVRSEGEYFSDSDSISISESDFFEKTLYRKLKDIKIYNARISTYAVYASVYYSGNGFRDEKAGYAYKITVSW